MAVQAHTDGGEARDGHRGAPDRAVNEPGADSTDYAHRHFVNLAAAAFVLFIALAVVWTVRAMEDFEKTQRCLWSGRRDCIDLNIPPKHAIRSPVR